MKETPEILYDVAIIGGGPAGMMTAGRAAERELKVILLEKNESLGKKLLISGGGRCNLTNAEPDVRAFLSKFKNDSKFLFSTFSQHSVKDTLEFFNNRFRIMTQLGKRVAIRGLHKTRQPKREHHQGDQHADRQQRQRP